MVKIYKHQGGSTQAVDRVDPAWLKPDSGVWVWVDLDSPTPEEARILTDVFHFHELAVDVWDDDLARTTRPKVGR